MAQIRIGCSGWNYKHWRERFYAKGVPVSRWFAVYADTFDTVEINNSFYMHDSTHRKAEARSAAGQIRRSLRKLLRVGPEVEEAAFVDSAR
jgi:uncharacterized protein YecE (DUF72 family)